MMRWTTFLMWGMAMIVLVIMIDVLFGVNIVEGVANILSRIFG